jgi:nucleoside-diphosphate-sugar epimerase
MRIAITGEKGFIARNLAVEISKNNHEFISLDNSSYANEFMNYTKSEEVCVHSNTVDKWVELFDELELDVIVHNAAVVGTDVVALNPKDAVLTNVLGTKIITEAANISGQTIVYTGTTVIYDTFEYQDKELSEESKVFPRTDYAIQKYAGEMIVRNNAKEWLVTRPLFAYGGEGDMNSLIAKSLFAIKNNIKNVDMFLNPEKIKDYMHVEDFCYSVIQLINSKIRNMDFNITAANPHSTLEIVNMIEEVTGKSLTDYIKWHPETDYLGNHRLSNNKFQEFMGFTKTRLLKSGISQSWESIQNSESNYNPLKHLKQAKEESVDLKEFFPMF